jgi:phospholipid/cholesterol/gamma-HCH transport system substrate-binding protein
MKQQTIETIVGLLVLFIAAAFIYFGYAKNNNTIGTTRYKLLVSFENIDGISEGADVKIAGMKIGNVEKIEFDNENYRALLTLHINQDVNVPEDSRAIISTNGIIGNKYIKISPGASEDYLANNGIIKFTQSALNIEDLISKLIYAFTSK